MGVIKRGILGGFSGRVGNIVGSSWKGIAVIKSLPLSVANPRTAKQIAVRKSFSETVKIAKQLMSAIIKPAWDRFASQMSGFNAFMLANVKNYSETVLDWYLAIVVSQGKMTALDITGATQSAVGEDVTLTWAAGLTDAYAGDDDNIVVAAVNTAEPGVVITADNEERADENITITVPATWDLATMLFAIVAIRKDGTVVSNANFMSANN